MDFTKSTILITGGNSGIGRGIAESLSALGAQIIITGRDIRRIGEVLQANPGMAGYELDISDAADIKSFAALVTERHPPLNAVIHNAGIMFIEEVLAESYELDIAEKTIATNLLGPIRLTAALLPHLRAQQEAAIVTVSSGLAFVPRADALTYSATKAAVHSWSLSLRHEFRRTSISVVEIAPPLVATGLTPGQEHNPRAMPLTDFVAEAVDLLCAKPTPTEVLVQRVRPQRFAEQSGDFDKVFAMINHA
ncbi:SDR family oxidoreductase [Phyllobacterium sp. K27]